MKAIREEIYIYLLAEYTAAVIVIVFKLFAATYICAMQSNDRQERYRAPNKANPKKIATRSFKRTATEIVSF